MASTPDAPQVAFKRGSILDVIERVGNLLPDPPLIFASLAIIVIFLSAIGSAMGWQVDRVRLVPEMVPALTAEGAPILDKSGAPAMTPKLDAVGDPVIRLESYGDPLTPRSLLTKDGIYWMLSSMLRNFTSTPALGLIFVAMLGIGVAEKFGLFGSLMRWLALSTPRFLLTPMIVFIGANASVASDAGYIILPPLAAALFAASGRPAIAGLAAAFAGVSGGFGGGFFPNAADGFLAGVATSAAHVIDPTFHPIEITHNYYFKAVSALMVTGVGWFITDRIVEPRLRRNMKSGGDTSAITEMSVTPAERRGLLAAGIVFVVVVGAFMSMILIPGAPLHGDGQQTLANGHILLEGPGAALTDESTPRTALRAMERAGARWSQVIVPIIALAFLIPGIAYGIVVGTCTSHRDLAEALYHAIRAIVPVLAILFFLGQFANYFQYTGLDRMLAYAGGGALVRADVPVPALIVLFILLVIVGDFAMSGMLSKFAILAPIFIPMFMMVGMSPELTTAAYRIGDSCVNIITPMNSYLAIILVVLQRYKPGAGIGSLMSLMIPYSIVLFTAWTGLLLAWFALDLPLGPDAPLHYIPRHAPAH